MVTLSFQVAFYFLWVSICLPCYKLSSDVWLGVPGSQFMLKRGPTKLTEGSSWGHRAHLLAAPPHGSREESWFPGGLQNLNLWIFPLGPVRFSRDRSAKDQPSGYDPGSREGGKGSGGAWVSGVVSHHHPARTTLASCTSLVKLLQRINFASLVRVGAEQSLGCGRTGTGSWIIPYIEMIFFPTKSPVFSAMHWSLPCKGSSTSISWPSLELSKVNLLPLSGHPSIDIKISASSARNPLSLIHLLSVLQRLVDAPSLLSCSLGPCGFSHFSFFCYRVIITVEGGREDKHINLPLLIST